MSPTIGMIYPDHAAEDEYPTAATLLGVALLLLSGYHRANFILALILGAGFLIDGGLRIASALSEDVSETLALYKRSGCHPLLIPVFTAVVVIVSLLLLTGTPYATYREGVQWLSLLVGPATVALAIPLFHQRRRVAAHAKAVAVALVAGSVTAAGSAVALGAALGLDATMLRTLAPKSVTSPIAMKTMNAIRPKIRISMNWMPSKPSPMNIEASRPPAARPASGPSQREAPLGAAAACLPAWDGAAWVCWGAWRVWWLGAEPKLLPPPKRLAWASSAKVRLIHSAMKMLSTRCIECSRLN